VDLRQMHACIGHAVVRTRMLSWIKKRVHHKHGSGNDLSNHDIFPKNALTLNILSLARQRCFSSWGPRRTPWFFL